MHLVSLYILKELRNYVEEFQFGAYNDVGGIMAFNA